MIERDRNPIDLRVVEPKPPRSALVTEREVEELRHWATVGRVLTATFVVACATYVIFNLGKLPW